MMETPVQSTRHSPETTMLLADYRRIRRRTEQLCEPLATDDYCVQSMPDASPVKWHLAHTSWFFETFALKPFCRGFRAFHPKFATLFNSYYNAAGPRWPRPERGLLSRPTVEEVYDYRAFIDDQLESFLDHRIDYTVEAIIRLGVNHEQQHQELILTDLKHALAQNPLRPVYRSTPPDRGSPPPQRWLTFAESLATIGFAGKGFSYDNESPRHRVFVESFELSNRLVTCGDFLAFIADDGYRRPELWLSEGWKACETHRWNAPLYWEKSSGSWVLMTLSGPRPLIEAEPVCHVSYFEADAYARWANARLPSEAEWEYALAEQPVAGYFLDSECYHPSIAAGSGPIHQAHGDVWQWTSSPYVPYPRYRPLVGALGEYNGKFMCNQLVLRGSSCATPADHARHTYRNFFPPDARWQFSGIRLARDLP